MFSRILFTLKSAESNAEQKGLSSPLVIREILANQASRNWHFGRHRRRKTKRRKDFNSCDSLWKCRCCWSNFKVRFSSSYSWRVDVISGIQRIITFIINLIRSEQRNWSTKIRSSSSIFPDSVSSSKYPRTVGTDVLRFFKKIHSNFAFWWK